LISSIPHVLSLKDEVQQKSGGEPTFPTLRFPDLLDCLHAESHPPENQKLHSSQLRVRKAGLPPLLHLAPDSSDMKMPIELNPLYCPAA
jgi:hypothetical protein